MKLGMTTFTIFRPFPRFLKFTSLWSMELQTKCRTPWMFGSSTFQQLGLKFVCKNGGNLMDRIAIYLWLVKILFSFTGVRHYTQHSDVGAVSWMTNIGGWIINFPLLHLGIMSAEGQMVPLQPQTLYIAYISWHPVDFILQQNDISRLYLLSLL